MVSYGLITFVPPHPRMPFVHHLPGIVLLCLAPVSYTSVHD